VYYGMGTRDHVPPEVFLKEPYPENLSIVAVCQKSNLSSSLHEDYVACLSDCVIAGLAAPEKFKREKIQLILKDSIGICFLRSLEIAGP